jgi:hypothetical protein
MPSNNCGKRFAVASYHREQTMNPEILERLLIDRASGELSPDVVALLAAYVSTDSESASQAAQINETLDLAKQALALRPQSALPSARFACQSSIPLSGSCAHWWTSRWAYGMAACFAGGLALGLLASRDTPRSPAEEFLSKNPVPNKAAAVETTFWTPQRLYPRHPAAVTNNNSRLIWKSPVRKPEIQSTL